jgi:hypothetical protein
VSGKSGDDAKPHQEREVQRAIAGSLAAEDQDEEEEEDDEDETDESKPNEP